MSATPETAPTEPKLLYKNLTSQDPRERAEEIDAAVHEYVTHFRNRPRFLVMHPDDYDAVLPYFRHNESQKDEVADRLHADLDRGTIILSDTDQDEWTTPEGSG
jgi:hypothetical protein